MKARVYERSVEGQVIQVVELCPPKEFQHLLADSLRESGFNVEGPYGRNDLPDEEAGQVNILPPGF